MEVEKYMIHVGDVLEDPDMCFAHLLEGKEKITVEPTRLDKSPETL